MEENTVRILVRRQLYAVMWVLSLFVFILFNEFSLSVGNYTRTSLFEYHFIAGVNISIVDAIYLCALFLITIISLVTGEVKVAKHPTAIVICAIIVLTFSFIRGMYRLENRTLVGMAELKAILLIIVFFIVSTAIFQSGNKKLTIYLPAVLLFARFLYEIVKYNYFPYIDGYVGARTKIPILALVYLPIFLAYIPCHSGKLQKVLLSLLVLLIIIVTVLSKSRTSVFIAVVSSFMVIMYIAFKFYFRRLSLLKVHIIFLLVLTVIVLPISFSLYRHSNFLRSFRFWTPQDIPQVHTNLGHYQDIQRGIALVKDSPIFGYGVGGQLPEFKTAVFAGLVHNEFLNFWVTFGFLGMVLWIYTFVLLPLKTFKGFDYLRKKTILKPEYFILFVLFPYGFARITVMPPFYFGYDGIVSVSMILAIQFNLLREVKQIAKANENRKG